MPFPLRKRHFLAKKVFMENMKIFFNKQMTDTAEYFMIEKTTKRR